MLQFEPYMPHPALRQYIRSYWLISGSNAKESLELVPDGYPEMFFVLANAVHMPQFNGSSRWNAASDTGVIGQVSGRFTFEMEAGSMLFCVKFYPWTPHLLFKLPAWQLNDAALDMGSVSARPSFRELRERVAGCREIPQAVTLLNDFFLEQFKDLSGENPFVMHVVQQIFRQNGVVSMDQLSGSFRTSRRYIELLFRQHIGFSPKQYARIIRVKKASMCLLDPRFKGQIREVAGQLDYFDQSHFLKDFKAVVRQSPSAFLQEQLNLSETSVLRYLDQWDYS
ncbi:MAG: helix-turn-helix transcriptional regulator [Saprospiraceae bacterium]|nr:helix-turn-helix transcriptional regulator [Saprospiraceae bacterium]